MRYLVVANPLAGHPYRMRMVKRLTAVLRAAGHEVRTLVTRPGETAHIRRALAELRPDRCVAAGGDGTVRDVAQCLWDTRSDAWLAVMPLGTANFLARVLGLPRDPRGAIPTILGGRARPLDLGLVNGRTVFTVAVGMGLDAAILRSAWRLQRAGWGLAAYWLAAARRVFRSRPFDVAAELDGTRICCRCRSLFIVNQIEFPGLRALTDRPPADGRIEAGFFDFLTAFRLTDRGLRFRTRRARQIHIRSLSIAPLVELDGDVVHLAVRRVERIRHAITAVAPA